MFYVCIICVKKLNKKNLKKKKFTIKSCSMEIGSFMCDFGVFGQGIDVNFRHTLTDALMVGGR